MKKKRIVTFYLVGPTSQTLRKLNALTGKIALIWFKYRFLGVSNSDCIKRNVRPVNYAIITLDV